MLFNPINSKCYLFLFFLVAQRGTWDLSSPTRVDQGLNPHPLQWKCRVLTTGPPGKSHQMLSFSHRINIKLLMRYFTFFFLVQNLQNPVCIVHLQFGLAPFQVLRTIRSSSLPYQTVQRPSWRQRGLEMPFSDCEPT